jgi:hypothetical protein
MMHAARQRKLSGFFDVQHRRSSRLMTIDSDWLVGAAEIATYIRRSTKSAYYLLEKKTLPGVKFAGKWQARKSKIDQALDDLQRQQAAE